MDKKLYKTHEVSVDNASSDKVLPKIENKFHIDYGSIVDDALPQKGLKKLKRIFIKTMKQ